MTALRDLCVRGCVGVGVCTISGKCIYICIHVYIYAYSYTHVHLCVLSVARKDLNPTWNSKMKFNITDISADLVIQVRLCFHVSFVFSF